MWLFAPKKFGKILDFLILVNIWFFFPLNLFFFPIFLFKINFMNK